MTGGAHGRSCHHYGDTQLTAQPVSWFSPVHNTETRRLPSAHALPSSLVGSSLLRLNTLTIRKQALLPHGMKRCTAHVFLYFSSNQSHSSVHSSCFHAHWSFVPRAAFINCNQWQLILLPTCQIQCPTALANLGYMTHGDKSRTSEGHSWSIQCRNGPHPNSKAIKIDFGGHPLNCSVHTTEIRVWAFTSWNREELAVQRCQPDFHCSRWLWAMTQGCRLVHWWGIFKIF